MTATLNVNIRNLAPVFFMFIAWLFCTANLQAQNVGIGTIFPQKRLSINGSVMLDITNKNYGTLDSAALLFGSSGGVGISSKKIGVSGLNGLNFWTGNQLHMSLSSTGSLGVGGDYMAGYKMYVHNGSSYFDGGIMAQDGRFTQLSIDGLHDVSYKLKVHNGHSFFGGDIRTSGIAAIGGPVDNNFRLRVYNGNSRFGGDAEVTGNLNTSSLEVANTLTIGGKGSVRSNGPSPLRIGFDQKYVNVFIAANDKVSVTANITDFAGDNDDVRTFVCQVVNDNGSLAWQEVGITIMGHDAAANTCTIWLHNQNGFNGILAGTIYLTTIAKN